MCAVDRGEEIICQIMQDHAQQTSSVDYPPVKSTLFTASFCVCSVHVWEVGCHILSILSAYKLGVKQYITLDNVDSAGICCCMYDSNAYLYITKQILAFDTIEGFMQFESLKCCQNSRT